MALVGTRDCAAELGVSEETVRRLHRDGKIPRYRVGRHLRFDVGEVREALRERSSPGEGDGGAAISPNFDALDAA